MKLVGRVRGDGVVVGFATISTPGFTREAYYARRDFELELEDGSTMTVQLDPDLHLSWPTRDKTRTWSSLADDPQCAPFLDDAPAPHVRVELTWAEVRGGDRVELTGEHERTFADAPSHRAAPDSSSHFLATRIATVPVARKPPAAPREWSIMAVLCGLVALAGIVFSAIVGTRTAAIGGLAFLGAAVWYAYSMSKPGAFFNRGGPIDPTFPNTIFWELSVLTISGILLFMFAKAELDPGTLDEEGVVLPIVSSWVIVAVAFVRVVFHRNRTSRLIRVALSTPRAQNGFRSVEGMLMTELTCTQKLISVDGVGDDTSYEHAYSTNITSDRVIVVRTEDGDVRVPHAVAWFTAARFRERPPPLDPDSKRDVEAKTRWAASEGETVLLCANIEDGRAMNRGANSILLVADPASARRALWGRRAVIALMLLIIGGAAALMFTKLAFLGLAPLQI